MIDIKETLDDVVRELNSAMDNHGPFHSRHEGYAILLEEVDELWDEIKTNGPPDRIYDEAKQVAAMALEIMILFGGRE